jgi:dipeptidyl aminopeptidase/acylaminoacyl peptidase
VTGFGDVREFVTAPRLTALRLSPDGAWLAAVVQTVAGEPPRYVTSIWRIPTEPGGAAVRLTRSAEGETAPEFLPDGSLLFVSKRPDAAGQAAAAGGAKDAAKDKPALWLLPAGGGEARRIAAPGGGVGGVSAAKAGRQVAYSAAMLRGATTPQEDDERRKARTDAGVAAILHESGRLRHWDHDLGPEQFRLLTAEVRDQDGSLEARDLTPEPGRALDEQHFELTPDGATLLTGWSVPEPGGEIRTEVVAIDVATGARRVLLAAPATDFEDPRVSPDGQHVVAVRIEHEDYERPGDMTLVVVPVQGGEARDLLPDFDRFPGEAVWARDSRSVFFTADHEGRKPVFNVDLESGKVTRITADHGAYDNVCAAPGALFALRAAVDSEPVPVRIDLADPAADPVRLTSPGASFELPGRLEEVTATAEDGTALRGWLVLPEGASAQSPAPLVLWVHGGPVSSWNSWSWRWNPWLMAARGYAVLLPDPALSTGYGLQMIVRGYGQWGGNPYTDVMAVTDAALARPDIDAGRTAMMGGSYGGYMANWIAGHTDRFRAIVSHAGLWALDQMFGTTDLPAFWRRMFGDPAVQPERYVANSPHLHVDNIVTPLLIIHGDKDYRVPIGEALRMWTDLTSRSKQAKLLYFPDENHWILKPGDAEVWYQTVYAFLAEHLLDEAWERPSLL